MRAPFGRVLAVVVVVVLTITACGSVPPAATPVRPAQHDDHAPPSAADLQATFEQLLGHHATLMNRYLRAQLGLDANIFEAAEQAMVDNTAHLAAAVESVHGAEAAAQFEQLWVLHVEKLAEYASALRDGDDALRDAARGGLDRYRADYGQFVQAATGGAISADAAAENLRVHLDHLMGHADAYHAGEYALAFELQRMAYNHMFPTGQALAGGLAGTRPGELPLAVETAGVQLRSTLGRLLGEHFELAVDAMRAAVSGDPSFEAIAGALNDNTSELTSAMDALFGPERAAAFNAAWGDHIDPLVAYTAALAERDEGGRREARARMTRAEDVLAATFAALTGGGVPVEVAKQAFSSHDDQLLRQIEAYATGELATAHQLSFEGYQHMFEVATTLAPAIEAALAGGRPVGGVQTGGGGTQLDDHAG